MGKTKIIFSVCVVAFVVLTSFSVYHKFYVSVTQIDYNKSQARVEITSRIFIDDLENTLAKRYNKKLNLATKIEAKEANLYLEEYLLSKMNLKINGKVEPLVFLGLEYEDDVVICYFKATFSKKITTFEYYNTVLTELYSEQQNIVHIAVSDEKQSFLLTKNKQNLLTKY